MLGIEHFWVTFPAILAGLFLFYVSSILVIMESKNRVSKKYIFYIFLFLLLLCITLTVNNKLDFYFFLKSLILFSTPILLGIFYGNSLIKFSEDQANLLEKLKKTLWNEKETTIYEQEMYKELKRKILINKDKFD